MAITCVHLSESANAMALPPAPANMSMTTVLLREVDAAKSSATLLFFLALELLGLWSECVLGNGLGGNTEPSVICHVDAIVIVREDAVPLVPVSK